MVKKIEKQDLVEVTDDFYIFPDGIKIDAEKVRRQASMSKMNSFEKEQMGAMAGKSYSMIIAEGMHRQVLEAREVERQKSEALKAKWEADRLRLVNAGKKLFDDGLMLIIHEGKILTSLEPIPPLTDDNWMRVTDYYFRLRPSMTNGEVKYALELLYLEKTFPGYRFILLRKDS